MLVRIVPQKGAIVSELSLDEINDVFDLRQILEPRLLAHSAPRFTTEDFEGLDDIHKRFEKAIKARNVSEWGQLNADFHMALYVHAPQPRTRAIVLSLLQTSDRYTRLQLSNTKAMGIAEKEHAHLIALCRALNKYSGVKGVIGLYLWSRTPSGGLALDRLMLRLPIVSALIRQLAVAQVTRSLATLLAGGITLVESWEIAAESITNRELRARSAKMSTIAGPMPL